MSKRITGRAALVCVAVLTGGCAHGPHQELADRDSVRSAEVFVRIPQKEFSAQIDNLNFSTQFYELGTAPGLVADAIELGINAHRNSRAAAAVRPAREALHDFDFDATFSNELQHELAALPWLNAQPPKVVKEIVEDARGNAAVHTKAGAVLFVDTVYAFTADFSTLQVAAAVALFPASPPRAIDHTSEEHAKHVRMSGLLDHSIYHNTIVVESHVDRPRTQPGNGDPPKANGNELQAHRRQVQAKVDELQANRDQWMVDEGTFLKRALPYQTAELARLIALDLQAHGVEEGGSEPRLVETHGASSVNRNPDGTLTATVALYEIPPPAPAIVTTAVPAQPGSPPAPAPADAQPTGVQPQ